MADRPDPGAREQDPRSRRRPRLLVGGVAMLILVVVGAAGAVTLTRDDRPRTPETADQPSTATDRDGEEKVVPLDGPYVLLPPHGFAIVGQEHQVPDYEFDVPGPRSTIELRTDGGAEMAISLIREFRRGALVDAAKALPDARVTEISAYAADGQLATQEAVLIPAGIHDERAHLVWQGAEHRGFDASFDDHVSRRERQNVVEAIRWSPAQPVGVRITAPLPVGWAAVPAPLYVDISLDQRTPPAEATAATFEVPPEPSRVCDLPVAALDRLGPDDAFVSVVDARGTGDPRARPPVTEFLPSDAAINLVPEGERDLTPELCLARQGDFRFNETSFAENGRIVRVFVGIGLEVTPETEAQILDVLERIVIEPPTALD